MNHQLNLKRQLRCIYLSDFFSGLRITDAVWVALLAARGFSLLEIGLAKSIYYTVSLLAEIPRTAGWPLTCSAVSAPSSWAVSWSWPTNLLIAFAPNPFVICLAMALNALSNALFSGTSSALTYSVQLEASRAAKQDYIQVSANEYQISQMLPMPLGSLTSLSPAAISSGLFRNSYLLSAAFDEAYFCPCHHTFRGTHRHRKLQASRKQHPLRELPAQFAQLIQGSLRVLRSCPSVGRLILSSAVISGSN